MSIPEKLYKYHSFDVQSISNLKNQKIYFSDPTLFNDPYDCALDFKLKQLEIDDYEKLLEYYIPNRDFPLVQKEALEQVLKKLKEGESIERFPALRSIEESLKASLLKIRELNFMKTGVSCFSECKDDILMWSYYADGHKGFCLEFETSFDPFKRAMPVKYRQEFPEMEITKILWDKNPEITFEPLLTKFVDWSHEKEYRVFHQESGVAFGYPSESLTGIYFGPEIKFEHIEIIALILRGQNPSVKLYQGHRSKEKFKIDFEEVFYTSYLERMN